MRKKLYLSIPIDESWNIMDDLMTQFNDFRWFAWNRGSRYNPEELDYSDGVVFALPNNRFDSQVSDLPAGLKSELKRAQSLKLPLFITYETMGGTRKIYQAEVSGNTFRAISGTSDIINQFSRSSQGSMTMDRNGMRSVSDSTFEKKVEDFVKSGTERRLLLLM